MLVTHPLNPIYDSQSKVLILGTMPSIKSREENFYYAHPKNRFWFILSKVYEEKIGNTKEEKIEYIYPKKWENEWRKKDEYRKSKNNRGI